MDDEIDIKALRESLGLTQAQLAEKLGLDRSSVSRMESGQHPKGPTRLLLQKMASDMKRPRGARSGAAA